MTRFRIAVAAAAIGLATGAASAQSAATAPGPDAAPPDKTAPGTAPATDLDAKTGTLSDKLSDTNGVIRPAGDVDPAMHKAAPQAGAMPVLKPGEVAPGTAK